MNNHMKQIGFPKTSYEFFLKLYHKKRGTPSHKDRNSRLEAIKAWVTLNEEEKKLFKETFNECRRKQMAVHLKKMEPFMKKKTIKRFQEVNISKCESLDSERCSDQEDSKNKNGNVNEDLYTNNLSVASSEVWNIQDQHNNTKEKHVEVTEVQFVKEPSPPNVRNAVELFNIINGEGNSEWSALPKAEKIRYGQAVYQLKKDYIKSYRIYLESLPIKELFIYYHKFDRNF